MLGRFLLVLESRHVRLNLHLLLPQRIDEDLLAQLVLLYDRLEPRFEPECKLSRMNYTTPSETFEDLQLFHLHIRLWDPWVFLVSHDLLHFRQHRFHPLVQLFPLSLLSLFEPLVLFLSHQKPR